MSSWSEKLNEVEVMEGWSDEMMEEDVTEVWSDNLVEEEKKMADGKFCKMEEVEEEIKEEVFAMGKRCLSKKKIKRGFRQRGGSERGSSNCRSSGRLKRKGRWSSG